MEDFDIKIAIMTKTEDRAKAIDLENPPFNFEQSETITSMFQRKINELKLKREQEKIKN